MADPRGPRVLAVRQDSEGDVLLTGPALRMLRAGASGLDLLVSPSGEAAARLLPGVDRVLVAEVPWAGDPAPVADPGALEALVDRVRAGRYDEVVVFSSYHQSPLPMALVARWAGVPRVSGTSDAAPGSLLDVRHRRLGEVDDTGTAGGHEVEAMCVLVAATGRARPEGDDGRLRVVDQPVPDGLPERYVVVHPGASVPARAIGAARAARHAAALAEAGWAVVVTGGPGDELLGAAVTPPGGSDLTGRTSLPVLAGVLRGASAVVVGNTGPAHLAAAVGTPVVSLFAPTVPAERWRPWAVDHVLLGDQQAPCSLSRARTCPVPGHPCTDVATDEVVAAVERLAGRPDARQPATVTGGVRS